MNCVCFTVLWKLRDPGILAIETADLNCLFWNYSLTFWPQFDVKIEVSARYPDAIRVTFQKEVTVTTCWRKQFPDSWRLTPEGGEVWCWGGGVCVRARARACVHVGACACACYQGTRDWGGVVLRMKRIPKFLRDCQMGISKKPTTVPPTLQKRETQLWSSHQPETWELLWPLPGPSPLKWANRGEWGRGKQTTILTPTADFPAAAPNPSWNQVS